MDPSRHDLIPGEALVDDDISCGFRCFDLLECHFPGIRREEAKAIFGGGGCFLARVCYALAGEVPQLHIFHTFDFVQSVFQRGGKNPVLYAGFRVKVREGGLLARARGCVNVFVL
jgi:hypothetical protein